MQFTPEQLMAMMVFFGIKIMNLETTNLQLQQVIATRDAEIKKLKEESEKTGDSPVT